MLKCGLLIFAVKVAFKIRGYGWTTRWIRRRAELVSRVTPFNPQAVGATEQAVAMAAALYPGRALCLEQSLVLYYLLRRQGMPVRLAIGVQARPFAAHAWVEHCGEPLNDIKEHTEWFARLPDVQP
jgi:transglutaminase superfamily protein